MLWCVTYLSLPNLVTVGSWPSAAARAQRSSPSSDCDTKSLPDVVRAGASKDQVTVDPCVVDAYLLQ